MAAKILESGKMTEEELAEMFKLTAKQLKAYYLYRNKMKKCGIIKRIWEVHNG